MAKSPGHNLTRPSRISRPVTLDQARLDTADRLDGSYLLKTDRQDQSAEEVWRIYTLLTRAEAAFRALKSPLVGRLSYPPGWLRAVATPIGGESRGPIPRKRQATQFGGPSAPWRKSHSSAESRRRSTSPGRQSTPSGTTSGALRNCGSASEPNTEREIPSARTNGIQPRSARCERCRVRHWAGTWAAYPTV